MKEGLNVVYNKFNKTYKVKGVEFTEKEVEDFISLYRGLKEAVKNIGIDQKTIGTWGEWDGKMSSMQE